MDDPTRDHASAVSRRGAILKLGGLAATALGAGAWGARELTDDADAAGSGPAAVSSGLVSCVLAPEQTEGPYYLDDHRVRRNITEGRPGTPLALRLSVVDVSTLQADPRRAVDIWHCDAAARTPDDRARASTLPARRAADGREGPRPLQVDLPGLVPGPHRAHPRHGLHRRERRAHGAALLPGHAHRPRVPEPPVLAAAGPDDAERRPTASTATAGAARR